MPVRLSIRQSHVTIVSKQLNISSHIFYSGPPFRRSTIPMVCHS